MKFVRISAQLMTAIAAMVVFLDGTCELMAQTVTVNFNAAGDLDNNFNIYQNVDPINGVTVTNAATGSPYSQALTGGIGGSGRVNIATTGITPDSTAIYKNTSFDFSTNGAVLNISPM